jgi:hypothetical protein
MRIPALKPFVKKLRGPNAGSTKYLNLSPRPIGSRGRRPNPGDRNGMFDRELCCGVGEGDGASGSSGSPDAEEEAYAEVA